MTGPEAPDHHYLRSFIVPRKVRLHDPPTAHGIAPWLCVHICVPYVMRFEWDEAKRRSNLGDHGVDFKDAALIFEGIVLEAEDTRSDYGERRFRALDRVGDDCFMVAYTWR